MHKKCTYILKNRDALILVVVKLLLLSQVLVFGGLKTHGDHLCAGQHPVDSSCRVLLRSVVLFCLGEAVLVGRDGG